MWLDVQCRAGSSRWSLYQVYLAAHSLFLLHEWNSVLHVKDVLFRLWMNMMMSRLDPSMRKNPKLLRSASIFYINKHHCLLSWYPHAWIRSHQDPLCYKQSYSTPVLFSLNPFKCIFNISTIRSSVNIIGHKHWLPITVVPKERATVTKWDHRQVALGSDYCIKKVERYSPKLLLDGKHENCSHAIHYDRPLTGAPGRKWWKWSLAKKKKIYQDNGASVCLMHRTGCHP